MKTAPDSKLKVQRIFRFLQELYQSKNPPTVHQKDYPWILTLDAIPFYPSIKRGSSIKHLSLEGSNTASGANQEESEYIFKASRPKETPCPRPSIAIENWLRADSEEFGVEPKPISKRTVKDAFGKETTEAFEDSAERVEAFSKFVEEKAHWQKAEKQVFDALNVFSKLFELRVRLEREFEKFELYLGDGIFVSDTPQGKIHHPLILQQVELLFDASKPEFTLKESSRSPILYTPALRFLGLDGKHINELKTALTEHSIHPLDTAVTTEYLKSFIHKHWPEGQFFQKHTEVPEGLAQNHLYRRPMIFLGQRNTDFVESLDQYIKCLNGEEALPESLLRIVGENRKKEAGPSEPSSFLLTKHANPQQIRVIDELNQSGAVLVQGPPGTGKSHTIANLIGHLLAQNKRILITSHTSKALRVVKHHVSKPLQPLCVSALHKDEDSGKELEDSISGILNTISKTDPKKLEKEIGILTEKREDIFQKIQNLKSELLALSKSETETLQSSYGKMKRFELAQKLHADHDKHSWIPGPLLQETLPLTEDQVNEIYFTQARITEEEEKFAASRIPGSVSLPSLKTFQDTIDQIRSTKDSAWKSGSEYWEHERQPHADLQTALLSVQNLLRDWSGRDPWIYECAAAPWSGPEGARAWSEWIQVVKTSAFEAPKLEPLVLSYDPQFDQEYLTQNSTEKLLALCDEIIVHLKTHKKLGVLSSLIHRKWKQFISHARVETGSPHKLEHFEALRAKLRLLELRESIRNRWHRQMEPYGAKSASALGPRPERVAIDFVPALEEALQWKSRYLDPLGRLLKDMGFHWDALFNRFSAQTASGKVQQVLEILETHVYVYLKARETFVGLQMLKTSKEGWLKTLEGYSKKDPAYPLVTELREAIRKSDYDQYRMAWEKLAELDESQKLQKRRDELLALLEPAAPAWVEAIRNRDAPHDGDKAPGAIALAWKFRLASQQLHAHHKLDHDQTEETLNALTEKLHEATSELVEKLAWKAQIARTGLAEQQALSGWLGLYKKMGKGTGKQVGRLKEEAKKALSSCLNAVPVWIMPMSRLTETFDIATTRFDVVLIDEASQSDVMGLVALAYAKEAVVVGDHEQVSPYAVGYQIDRIQALIDEILVDIPNRQLYDGRTSVYDLARQSFGGTIRLIEHFRCVPDIIQFCNQLSYGGEILPLRESDSSKFHPHVIVRRCLDGKGDEKVNEREAHEIASTICSMVKIPDFEGATIGVICLVGTEQALAIDAILRRRLSVSEYQSRRILCGNASQFQGDERDIIFLSVVDTPQPEKTLTLRASDEWRKIYNVAVSRARDQLWIVHSLDPSRDLKKGDLRLQLINYAEELSAPESDKPAVKIHLPQAIELMKAKLEAERFNVMPSYRIADYTIDLVVHSKGRRLGVLYHGEEDLVDEERSIRIERELTLKRLGWSFVNLSATRFYLDPDKECQRVKKVLLKLGLEPQSTQTPVASPPLEAPPSALDLLLKKAETMRSRWNE